MEDYYGPTGCNSNVHRGVHNLSSRATAAYEEARDKIARFIHARSSREVVFVKNASEGINLIANTWGTANIKQGDEVNSLSQPFSKSIFDLNPLYALHQAQTSLHCQEVMYLVCLQIILSVAEHHSNLVPWHMLAARTGAKLRFVPLTKDGTELDMAVCPLTVSAAVPGIGTCSCCAYVTSTAAVQM